jgi:hypothetical protein
MLSRSPLFWLSANEFLCIMQKENENRASIYRMSLDGKNPSNTRERRALARLKDYVNTALSC